MTVSPLIRLTGWPYIPARSGPRLPDSEEWQVWQLKRLNSCPPASAIERAGPVSPTNQAWYSSGSITYTEPTILEWSVPQNSAQKRWYLPGLVASNQAVV